MRYAGFATLEDAKAHRSQHGGWIYLPNETDREVLWFSLHYTPTPIMQHPATSRGTGGRLM